MPNPKLRGLGKIPKIGEMGAPRTLYASLILHLTQGVDRALLGQ